MSSEHQQELEAYRRVLERERRARKLAEEQLEDYSWEIYQSNALLAEQTIQAQAKQQHLAFLISVAEDNWRSESVADLINVYLQKSCTFLTAPVAVYFQIEADLSLSRLQIAKPTDLFDQPCRVANEKFINATLEHMDLAKVRSDFLSRDRGALFSSMEYMPEAKAELAAQIYLLPVFHSKGKELNKLSCMCFYYEQLDDVDLMKLETIEASHSIFSVAIERKKAESALKKKVNELLESNTHLQQIQQQLIESEKLASLGQLSAGIAHEINNPVGFVLSNLSTMAEYVEDVTKVLTPLYDESLAVTDRISQWRALSKEYEMDFLLDDTNKILVSSVQGLERVKDIVSDLGSFARMDSDDLVTVDVNQVIHKALNILKNELKYNHIVELDLEGDLKILGNDGQLQQVFINFFINAKHAMPDGGHLWISSKKVRERVVVSIKDEGHGIAPEEVKEIFTPFFTTKPPGQGTGLGLSISYSILQRHHAKISVDSVVDQGTEFKLSFIPSD